MYLEKLSIRSIKKQDHHQQINQLVWEIVTSTRDEIWLESDKKGATTCETAFHFEWKDRETKDNWLKIDYIRDWRLAKTGQKRRNKRWFKKS